MPLPELTPEHRALLEKVRKRFDAADDHHKQLRSRWEELYRLYRSYQDAKAYVRDHPDRDEGLREVGTEWGSDLFIPYAFSTVETIVPRMLSNRPRGVILPRDEQAVANESHMALMLEAQQDQARYQLTAQTTAKSGQIYGLGIQKTGWRKQTREGSRLVRATGLNGFGWTVAPVVEALYDDPFAEDVDIFDFLWDPRGSHLGTCEYVIHRAWRSPGYVLARIRSGEWDLAGYLTAEDVQALGSPEEFSQVWAERLNARGISTSAPRGDHIHEVWEFHDRGYVCTILDRQVPVREIVNPHWHGDYPFAAYRPSEVPHEFCGVGAIEPMRDLQYEMNVLRSQRRDMATLALSPTYAFQDGIVDPAHIKIGPGMLIPVQGEPRDLLQRVQLGDVPASGYNEEDRIRADIERTTGMADAVQGGSQMAGTATEAQLQLAAANVRVQNMTYRFEVECIETVMNHWLALNQQHITEQRGVPVELPAPGRPDRRWSWFAIGPEHLQGAMQWRALGGSTAPDNVPQDRQDAQMMLSTLGQNPNVDQRRLMPLVMEKLGIRHPDQFLAPERRVPPETLDFIKNALVEQGLPADGVHQLLEQALAAAQQAEQQQGQGQQQLPPGGPPQ